ncbi:MAG: hypothetical protein HY820_29285 [Acidobacteria bacterium]|nr:hypothetical protein [Acidobacteriota bacterium]
MTVSLMRKIALAAAFAAIASVPIVSVPIMSAQGPIRGPMLGWVWDARQQSIRPILGITGSSVLGKSADLGFVVKAAAISGGKEFAFVLGGDEKAPYFVDLRDVTPAVKLLEEIPSGAKSLTLSPKGGSGALWFEETNKLLLLTGLGTESIVRQELDLTNEGAPAAIAVSDDGTLVLVSYPDVPALIAIDRDGNRTRLPQETAVRAMTFLEDSHDAVYSTTEGVLLAKEIPAVTEVSNVAEGDSYGPVALLDARRVLMINTTTAAVTEVNVETAETRSAECPCTPTGLNRMINGGIFRLNEVSGDPLWLVEVSDSGLRTVFVPPDPAEPQTEE